MSTNGLSPPGTSTYDSNTMYVGDGTWDSSRNDFLLPNLQGLNFATMQYNGMGNRFRGDAQYHSLVLGHAVCAAITFIGLLPTAIFVARFYSFDRRAAFKMHVYLQVLIVLFATIVLILGWFAVGPERSLTNPHHGIGVAIYTCVLVNFLYGWLMARSERKRSRPHPTIPLRVWLHKLFGRAVALLAFVQVALGLTLYGSPKVLFILYALAGALLLFAYLALSYANKPHIGPGGPPPPRSDYYSDYDSRISGTNTQTQTDFTQPSRQDNKTHWGRDLLAAGGIVGAYEWWRHRRDRQGRRQDQRTDQDPPNRPRPSSRPPNYNRSNTPAPYGRRPPPGDSLYTDSRPPSPGSRLSRRPSQSRVATQSWEHDDDEDEDDEDEKYSDTPRKQNTWRDRLIGAGAGIAAFQGVRGLLGRKNRQNDKSGDKSNYRPPLGGNHNMASQADVSQVESGHAPFSPNDTRDNSRVNMTDLSTMTPTRPPARRRPSMTTMSYDDSATDYTTPQRPVRPRNDATLRDTIASMGAIAGFREWNRRRRERQEDSRAERIRQQELEQEEQFNRRSSSHYPQPQDANARRSSISDTLMTGPETAPISNLGTSRHDSLPNLDRPPLPAGAGALPSTSGPLASTVGPSISRQNVADQRQTYSIPPPPPGVSSGAPPPGSLQMPQGAVDPDPSRLMRTSPAAQASQNIQQGGIPPSLQPAAGAAAGAATMAALQPTQSHSPSRYRGRDSSLTGQQQQRGSRRGSFASPPLSQLNSVVEVPAQSPSSPPVSVKVKMHNDGRHITLRRLNEEEAAAERAARRRPDRRTRRGSSLSSEVDDDVGSSRFRRGGGGPSAIRNSSQQPIVNIPPPPPMSNSGGGSTARPGSDPNLPPTISAFAGAQPGQMQGNIAPPYPATSPSNAGMTAGAAPPVPGNIGSPSGTATGGLNYGTDLGTTTDGSTFDNNRRRRRAERARKEAARGNNHVEFS